MRMPGVWPSNRPRERPDQPPNGTGNQTEREAEHSAPQQQVSNFLKLKEEVVKYPHLYVQRRAPAIGRTLGADHEVVKSLSSFGDQAWKFAAEILAIVE